MLISKSYNKAFEKQGWQIDFKQIKSFSITDFQIFFIKCSISFSTRDSNVLLFQQQTTTFGYYFFISKNRHWQKCAKIIFTLKKI